MPSMPGGGEASDVISGRGRCGGTRALAWTDELSAPAELEVRNCVKGGSRRPLHVERPLRHHDRIVSRQLAPRTLAIALQNRGPRPHGRGPRFVACVAGALVRPWSWR